MEIIQDKRNLLFRRNEIVFDIVSEKNPSFSEMKKLVAQKLSKPEENVDVKNVKGGFGRNNFEVKVLVYDSKEDMDSVNKLELTGKQREETRKAAAEAKKKAEDAKKAEDKTETKIEGSETLENKTPENSHEN